jgi:hypothetical protein
MNDVVDEKDLFLVLTFDGAGIVMRKEDRKRSRPRLPDPALEPYPNMFACLHDAEDGLTMADRGTRLARRSHR